MIQPHIAPTKKKSRQTKKTPGYTTIQIRLIIQYINLLIREIESTEDHQFPTLVSIHTRIAILRYKMLSVTGNFNPYFWDTHFTF